MRKTKHWLMTIAALLSSLGMSAASIVGSGTSGSNLTWKLTDEGVLFIEGTGEMTSCPWKTDYKLKIKTVKIEEGVTSIGYNAFYSCSNLTAITIPESVTSIGEAAFQYCRNLTAITIPESVTIIGRYAFEYCSNLTTITIPESVTSIGYKAFNGTAWLNNKSDGVIYINNLLHMYKGTMPENTSIDIKEGTTSIGDHAFYSCRNLIAITIPESVTSIGEFAFSHCNKLTNLNIPQSMTTIGNYAFEFCSNLANIAIPENVTSIGDNAFYECSSLTDITIPESVTSIGNCAFEFCSNLATITISESVTSIGYYAFFGTAWLNNKSDGVIYINNQLYMYKGTMPENTSIDVKEGTTCIVGCAFERCYGLTAINIPESVTSIGEEAFFYCEGLTTINIPKSVTSIGKEAFGCCFKLTDIYFESNPQIATDAILSPAKCHLTLDDADNVDFNTANANTYADASYTRAINASKYGTIILPFAPDAESLENFAFFALSNNDGEYLLFDEVAEPQANTPYLYTLREGKEAALITGGSTTISSEIVTPEMDGWKTVGSFTNQTIITEEDAENNYYAYTSADNQLHRVTKKLTVKPYRAYFTANGSQPAQLAIRTRGGDVTVIDAAEVEDLAPAVYYDLSGRRVDNPTKGMYIVNGKKVIL